MITLYQLATSPFTEKVRRSLNYKGIRFDVHEVDRAKAASGGYVGISPTAKFPAIEHDGVAVWDSTDILEYLDRVFPERPLIPADPRQRGVAHAFEEWADESLYFYEITARLSWEHNLAAALDEFAVGFPNVPKEALKKQILDGAGGLVRTQGIGRKPKEQIVRDIERQLSALDAALADGGWLVGSALTSADVAVIAQLNALLYAQEARAALERTKNVKAWMARVDETAPVTARS